MTGTTLSHYRVIERIGEGGNAVVYKAEDLTLGRPVALKLLPPALSLDLGRIARFQHEARTTSTLNHPNICTIYEVGEHEGRHFIAMEYLEGEPLSRLMGGRSVECYRLVELAIQIADGLEAAHAERVVHRDLKPANIYVTYRDHIKLLDFGLAVLMPFATGSRTPSSTTWLSDPGGTVPYMSPEQTLGEQLDTRSDLFSFGVVLYEMATGARPFTGGASAALMDAIRQEQPFPARDLNTGVPDELDRIISKALEKNRKLRYQTASDIGADLRRLKRDLDSQKIPTVRVTAPPVPIEPEAVAGRSPAHGRMWAIAQLAAAAAIGGALAVFGMPWARLPVPAEVHSGAPAGTPAARAPGPTAATPTTIAAPPALPAARSTVVPAPTASAPPGGLASPAGAAGDRPATSRTAYASSEQQLRIAQSQVAVQLYDQALGTLQELVKTDPQSPAAEKAYLLMASVHETRGRHDDAISTYLEMTIRYPDNPRVARGLFQMADATLRSKQRGKEAEARRIYSVIAEKHRSTEWAPRALLERGQLEDRQKLRQVDPTTGTSVPSALLTYRHLTEAHPRSPEREQALARLAPLYLGLERYDMAAATLSELGERYASGSHDAWFAAAEIYEKRLRDDSRARAAYARVPSTSPKYEVAQRRLTRH